MTKIVKKTDIFLKTKPKIQKQPPNCHKVCFNQNSSISFRKRSLDREHIQYFLPRHWQETLYRSHICVHVCVCIWYHLPEAAVCLKSPTRPGTWELKRIEIDFSVSWIQDRWVSPVTERKTGDDPALAPVCLCCFYLCWASPDPPVTATHGLFLGEIKVRICPRFFSPLPPVLERIKLQRILLCSAETYHIVIINTMTGGALASGSFFRNIVF